LESNTMEAICPWGRYQVIGEAQGYKVKRITVHSCRRLSLQRHRRRAEHWFILQGDALVTKDGKELAMTSGQSIDIPAGCWHRILNRGEEDLIFVEIQTGDHFGEDDIERIEDDYGRI
jgi:mannose-6-phosphate isomerase-like protein (cupin superfamily)